MLMHMQVASSVERPAADGEESEKANGHAEVKTKIQVYKYKYSNTKKKTIYHLVYKDENVCICVDKFYIFFVTQFLTVSCYRWRHPQARRRTLQSPFRNGEKSVTAFT